MSKIIVGDNYIAAATGGSLILTSLRTTQGSDILVNSPATVIAEYIIQTLALMTRPSVQGNWPLYVASMPDGDNVETNVGAVYDTLGIKDGRLMIGSMIQHYGMQIRIRSREYNEGFEKIEDIVSDLDAVLNQTIEISPLEYEILNVSRTSPIVPLGLERDSTKRRFLFTTNFLATIKELTG